MLGTRGLRGNYHCACLVKAFSRLESGSFLELPVQLVLPGLANKSAECSVKCLSDQTVNIFFVYLKYCAGRPVNAVLVKWGKRIRGSDQLW